MAHKASKRGQILAPHNSIVEEINHAFLAKFPRKEWVCSFADTIVDDKNEVAIPSECLTHLGS